MLMTKPEGLEILDFLFTLSFSILSPCINYHYFCFKEPLEDRLKKLITASKCMLFMKGDPAAPKCGFSRQTVELLQSLNVEFGSFDILSDEEIRQGLKTYSNWPTYPQLYLNGELLGGLVRLSNSITSKSRVKTKLFHTSMLFSNENTFKGCSRML